MIIAIKTNPIQSIHETNKQTDYKGKNQSESAQRTSEKRRTRSNKREKRTHESGEEDGSIAGEVEAREGGGDGSGAGELVLQSGSHLNTGSSSDHEGMKEEEWRQFP